jgi:hypothetical protein
MMYPGEATAGEQQEGITAPLRVLRCVAFGALLLPVIFGVMTGNAVVALNTLAIFGLVPLLCAWSYVAVSAATTSTERSETTAEVAVLASVCWAPVVLLTGLRDDVWRTTPSAMTAVGIGALLVCMASVLAGTRPRRGDVASAPTLAQVAHAAPTQAS